MLEPVFLSPNKISNELLDALLKIEIVFVLESENNINT